MVRGKSYRSLFNAFILILFTGLLIQGCAAQEAEIPQVVTEVKEWCSGKDDYMEDLLELGDELAQGITVEGCFPNAKDRYTIKSYTLDPGEWDEIKKIDSPFPIRNLLVYIKVFEGEKEVSQFDIPLQLRITYTPEAWEAIKKGGYEYPRLAYLIRSQTEWGGEWVEFSPKIMQAVRPDTSSDTGVIYLEIPELPDPLIGGC